MIIPPLQPDVPPKKSNEPAPAPTGPACMNCGTQLEARFCHVCGQRKQNRVASLFALAGELIEGIFDIESRLWRTLWPLFARPGQLTKSFMDGKRERYLPPVRLYLISSIIFFLLISMSPRSYINEVSAAISSLKGDETSAFTQGLDTEITAVTGRAFAIIVSQISDKRNNSTASPDSPLKDESDVIEAVSDGASTVTINNREVVDVDSEPQLPEVEPVAVDAAGANIPDSNESNADEAEKSNGALSVTTGDDDNATADDMGDFEVATECEELLNPEKIFNMEFMRIPLYRGCISISTWGGLLDFLGELIDSLPKTLFILLPLMAIVNKFLYLFAGRYYVEHLLYYVHNFSFLFLFTVLLTGITKLADLAGIGVGVSNVMLPLGILYTIYYFFKSMRVVYGQGFFFTFTKWVALSIAFFVLVSIIFVFFTLAAAAVHGI